MSESIKEKTLHSLRLFSTGAYMKHVKKTLGYAMVMIVGFTMGVSASRFGHMDAAYSALETAEREVNRSFDNLPGHVFGGHRQAAKDHIIAAMREIKAGIRYAN